MRFNVGGSATGQEDPSILLLGSSASRHQHPTCIRYQPSEGGFYLIHIILFIHNQKCSSPLLPSECLTMLRIATGRPPYTTVVCQPLYEGGHVIGYDGMFQLMRISLCVV